MSGNCLGKEEPKADLGEVNSSETGLLKKERNKGVMETILPWRELSITLSSGEGAKREFEILK